MYVFVPRVVVMTTQSENVIISGFVRDVIIVMTSAQRTWEKNERIARIDYMCLHKLMSWCDAKELSLYTNQALTVAYMNQALTI